MDLAPSTGAESHPMSRWLPVNRLIDQYWCWRSPYVQMACWKCTYLPVLCWKSPYVKLHFTKLTCIGNSLEWFRKPLKYFTWINWRHKIKLLWLYFNTFSSTRLSIRQRCKNCHDWLRPTIFIQQISPKRKALWTFTKSYIPIEGESFQDRMGCSGMLENKGALF